MKKVILLVFLSIWMLPTFASHLSGGEMTWKKVGNNKIVLSLKMYSDCASGPSQPSSIQLMSNIPNYPSISLTAVSRHDLAPPCNGASSITCGSLGTGALQVVHYQSQVLTIPQPIPATGYYFKQSQCCLPSNVVNLSRSPSTLLSIEATVYSLTADADSPQFLSNNLYLSGGNSINLQASRPAAGDSLYYEFMTVATYGAGYSASSPLPNSSTQLDHQSGLLTYDMTGAAGGFYHMALEVECWRNGQLQSVVHRQALYYYDSTSSGANRSPSVLIDTSANKKLSRNNISYTAEVVPGDTLTFEINAADFDMLSSGLPQTIYFDAFGEALSSSWGGNLNFNNHPSLSPVAPQSGFANTLNNNIRFEWNIRNEHLTGNSSKYHFLLRFKDDMCSVPGRSQVMLEVVVKRVSIAGQDTLKICSGDSVQLPGATASGSYSWSPAAGLSSTSVGKPSASPINSGYYYLEDPQHPGSKDSVYVEVEQQGLFNLAYNNSILELTDSVNSGSRMWNYNGIPFVYFWDTLSPFGPGNYFVELTTDNCDYTTDTLSVQPGSFSVIQPGNGGYFGNQTSFTGSIGVSFNLDGSGNLSTVSIPGVKDLETESGGYELTLKIYDQNQQEQYAKQITLQPPFGGLVEIPVSFALSAGVDYTIALTGDTSYAFSLYENVSLPFTPWSNGLNVTGYSEGLAGMYPASSSDYLLPLAMEVSNFVGLDEGEHSKVVIYPNPAEDAAHLENLEEGSEILLLDATGAVLRNYEVQGSSLSISRGNLAAGVYLVKIKSETAQHTMRLVFR